MVGIFWRSTAGVAARSGSGEVLWVSGGEVASQMSVFVFSHLLRLLLLALWL